MKTVANILQRKGHDYYWVRPEDTVFAALTEMEERDVGALLVMAGDRLVGIVSERDYARKVALLDRSSRSTSVAEIMTARVVVVPPEHTVDACMALMTDKHIRHLPVVQDDAVVGVISIGDVVEAMISEQEFMIEQLERYISGSG